jgi:hypothetical protein
MVSTFSLFAEKSRFMAFMSRSVLAWSSVPAAPLEPVT